MPVFTTAVTNCWITPNVPKLRPQIYTHNRSSRPRAGTPRRLRPRVKVFYDLPVRHARPLQVVRLNRCSAMLASFFFFFSQKRSRLWIMTVSIIKGRYDLRLNRKGSGLAHLVWQIIRRGGSCHGLLQVFLWNDSAIIFNYIEIWRGLKRVEINW